jgi:hypothetical protein
MGSSLGRKSPLRAVIFQKRKAHWPANPGYGPLSFEKGLLIGPQILLMGRYPSQRGAHWPANLDYVVPLSFTNGELIGP